MTDRADAQPRTLDDVPRGVWLGASALREQEAPVGDPALHICGIEIEAVTTHGETITVRYWQRDCAGCWDAGWRPRGWGEAVERARLAALRRQQIEAQIAETGGDVTADPTVESAPRDPQPEEECQT